MSGPRVGIIGAGQLGRMMALAAYPLGIECRFVDTRADSPGGQVGSIHVAELDDADALARLAAEVDVVTFDIENVAVDRLRSIETTVPVHPGPDIVAAAQDRLSEKRLFESLSIPTAPYVVIDSDADLDSVAAELDWPVVLKARRLGYDGRGQRVANTAHELAAAWNGLGRPAALAEGWVDFERELSLIAVRGGDGRSEFYPLTENVHANGILISSLAPYEDAGLQQQAQTWLDALMQNFDYRGVLTVEFFLSPKGLVANEIAPRVHNSGHWTIEGASTSQFENHIRGILGLPLGRADALMHAAMLNLLGEMPARELILGIDGAHLHDYGKEPRPARKLGHCTLLDDDRARLQTRVEQLKRLIDPAD